MSSLRPFRSPWLGAAVLGALTATSTARAEDEAPATIGTSPPNAPPSGATASPPNASPPASGTVTAVPGASANALPVELHVESGSLSPEAVRLALEEELGVYVALQSTPAPLRIVEKKARRLCVMCPEPMSNMPSSRKHSNALPSL